MFFSLLFSQETNRTQIRTPITFKSSRFSQPLGTCKSRSNSRDSVSKVAPPSKSLVIKAVDFAPPGSLPAFLSSLYPLESLTRELTSAAIFTRKKGSSSSPTTTIRERVEEWGCFVLNWGSFINTYVCIYIYERGGGIYMVRYKNLEKLVLTSSVFFYYFLFLPLLYWKNFEYYNSTSLINCFIYWLLNDLIMACGWSWGEVLKKGRRLCKWQPLMLWYPVDIFGS